jgi:hypothetical protein
MDSFDVIAHGNRRAVPKSIQWYDTMSSQGQIRKNVKAWSCQVGIILLSILPGGPMEKSLVAMATLAGAPDRGAAGRCNLHTTKIYYSTSFGTKCHKYFIPP